MRRLSPQERAHRRQRLNLLLFLIGFVLLVIAALLLPRMGHVFELR